MVPGVYDFCAREARAALLGAILVHHGRIMRSPDRIWMAEQKVLQLAAARGVGLRVPETVITNEPDEVRRAFCRFEGRMIVKPVRTGFVDYGTEQQAVYTTQVLESHLADLEDARWSPAIYQPLLQKRCDVRVTVVGSKTFVAEIDSQTDPAAAVDWRRTINPQLPHRRADLPLAIRSLLHRLLSDLGLAFAAVDFVHTVDDDYVFLEINPNGQWLWLDDLLGLGVTEAVASWLAGGESE